MGHTKVFTFFLSLNLPAILPAIEEWSVSDFNTKVATVDNEFLEFKYDTITYQRIHIEVYKVSVHILNVSHSFLLQAVAA